MKIGIIGESYLPRINGVSNSVDRVATYLSNMGHEVTVITAGKTDILYNRKFEVIRLHSITLPQIPDYDFPLVGSGTFKEIFRKKKFDLIHVASPFVTGYLALKAAHKLSIPSVSIYQTDVSGFAQYYGFNILGRFADYWIKKIHKLSNLNLVPSNWARIKLEMMSVPNLKVWGRGVDLERFDLNFRSLNLRNEWNKNAKLFVGYVGRLAPEKNIEYLECVEKDPNIQIVIIGDGPHRKKLQAKFPNAVFTGRLTGYELSKAYASLDVLFAPGENETFCQVAQEALASGLFVFAPNKGATQELISNEHSGYIYEKGDQKKINSILQTLIQDSAKLSKIKTLNRQSVINNDWEANCAKLYNYYLEITQPRSEVKV